MPPARSPSELQIRPAASADCDALARIYNQAIASGQSTMHTQPVEGTFFAGFLRQQGREAILVGELNERVVGWGVVKQYSDRPGYRYACETSVYVDDAAQGRGFGSALQQAVMAQASALGYHHLVAKILAVNAHSIRFHQGFGFDIVGRQRAIGYLHGAWHDVIIMQCLLEEQHT